MAHRDNKYHVQWNLESTAKLVHSQFPSSHVWVVKPSQMHLKTFSAFCNFVTSSAIGNPEHGEGQGSWYHLRDLLSEAVIRLEQDRSTPTQTCDTDMAQCKHYIDIPVTLIGFSKGCVVLNQLIYELEEAKHDPELASFVEKIKHIYWLDGGHNGGSKIWIVDEEILTSLVDTGIQVHSYVTPYQMKDPMRKWVAKEQKKFVKNLRKLNVPVDNIVHFEEEERHINIHFRVLEVINWKT